MIFRFSRHGLSGLEAILQRMLEMLPGLTSWTILIGMSVLSVTEPLAAAVLIIAFYLYWLLRLLYMTIFLVLSYLRLRSERKTDWCARLQGMDDVPAYAAALQNAREDLGDSGNIWRRMSRRAHHKDVQALLASGTPPPKARDIYHLVIYPVVKEGRDIVEPGIRSFVEQDYDRQRVLFIFALEERAAPEIQDMVHALARQYATQFLDVRVIVHPKNLPGEAVVKGANVTYAARQAADIFAKKNIPFDNVVLSCFDADTVIPKHYLSALTYYFMMTPQRERASFQPVPVYHNNIWEVPGFARVIEAGSSFFQLIEATNPAKLVTFSSHSMSFKALVEADYWPVDMISDDSAIYWKCFLHYRGDYRVIPMYVTLSMDVAGSTSFRDTCRSVYKQKRRWAWGVENFPIVMRGFFKIQGIPLRAKLQKGFKLYEGHVSWATWGFLLTFIGWLPGLFAQNDYASSVAYYNVPRTSALIFQLAAISMVCSIIISVRLLPRKTGRTMLRHRIQHAVEWLFIPVILLIFSALPALDAQTRLLWGRYMEFWVTTKSRRRRKR